MRVVHRSFRMTENELCKTAKTCCAFAVTLCLAAAQGAEKWPETPPPTGKSVTWERLNKLDPGLKQIGRLAV